VTSRALRPFLPAAAFLAFIGVALAHVKLPAFCLFKAATGIPCPGCGVTRSIVALLHGDFSHATAAGIAVLLFFAHSAAIAIAEATAAIAPEAAAARRLVADKLLLASLLLAWVIKL
jgi:Protein of unknown function (DUF2752)